MKYNIYQAKLLECIIYNGYPHTCPETLSRHNYSVIFEECKTSEVTTV